MKLLFLNYEYPPLGGGAGVATEALMKEFAKRPGLEVHLVTSAVGSTLEHIRVGGDVYVHRLPIGKNPTRLQSQSLRDIIVYTWKSFWFTQSFLKREAKPFDATLAFFTIPCGLVASLLKLRFRLPYAVSLRGADVPGFSEKYDGMYLFLKPLVRSVWKHATVVIPNSRGIAALAQRTDSARSMTIIENGVDTEVFRPRQDGSPEEDTIVFFSSSRLTKRKAIDTLIHAFALASQKTERKMRLDIAGDGEELPSLVRLTEGLGIKERVRFLGRIPHDHLAELYRKATVFVLPSRNEGMSNAALEALASGLPLIVSKTGGMDELVSENENGLFVDPDDAQGFARVLVRLAEDGDLRRRLGGVSRTKAEARSWNVVAEKFLQELSK